MPAAAASHDGAEIVIANNQLLLRRIRVPPYCRRDVFVLANQHNRNGGVVLGLWPGSARSACLPRSGQVLPRWQLSSYAVRRFNQCDTTGCPDLGLGPFILRRRVLTRLTRIHSGP
jgi:hypothetical protein